MPSPTTIHILGIGSEDITTRVRSCKEVTGLIEAMFEIDHLLVLIIITDDTAQGHGVGERASRKHSDNSKWQIPCTKSKENMDFNT